MSGPVKLTYDEAERSPSGMVVEELPADQAPGSGRWPFESSRWVVPPGATSELDQHDVVEIWMVRRGDGLLASGDTEMRLRAGDSVLMPSRVPHRVTALGAEPFEAFSIWWPQEGR